MTRNLSLGEISVEVDRLAAEMDAARDNLPRNWGGGRVSRVAAGRVKPHLLQLKQQVDAIEPGQITIDLSKRLARLLGEFDGPPKAGWHGMYPGYNFFSD